jgi:hypothetical protein
MLAAADNEVAVQYQTVAHRARLANAPLDSRDYLEVAKARTDNSISTQVTYKLINLVSLSKH